MALNLRRVGDPLLMTMIALWNQLKGEMTGASTTLPHADITSYTGGYEVSPGMPTATQVQVAGTTSNLAHVVSLAESARSVLLLHFADDLAHQEADAINNDGISYAALPPLLPTTAPLPAVKTGSGATYASVTADHTLVLKIGEALVTVTFTGSEASQGDFHSAINSALNAVLQTGSAYLRNNGGESQIVANPVYNRPPTGSVVSGDTDVLASLGFSAGDALVLVTYVTQPASQGQADDLLNACKAAYEAHRVESDVHYTNDSTNTISASDATNLGESQTLGTELKSDINAHVAFGLTTPSVKLVQG